MDFDLKLSSISFMIVSISVSMYNEVRCVHTLVCYVIYAWSPFHYWYEVEPKVEPQLITLFLIEKS